MKIKYHSIEFTPLQLISYIHFNSKLWLLKLLKKILFRDAGVILDCHFVTKIHSGAVLNFKSEKKKYIIEGNTFELEEK